MDVNRIKMSDYLKEYLDTSFKNVQDSIAEIKTQVNNLTIEVSNLKEGVLLQYDNCQNTTDVKDLKKNIGEFNTIKKYWMVFAVALTAITVVWVVVGTESIQKLKAVTKPNTEYRQKQDSIQTIKDDKEIKSMIK